MITFNFKTLSPTHPRAVPLRGVADGQDDDRAPVACRGKRAERGREAMIIQEAASRAAHTLFSAGGGNDDAPRVFEGHVAPEDE